jgi:tetratricopeptide (TPR) repeat protein
LNALNNFRELFYDAGVPSLIFMTPAELDDVIWKAPDFWRYRGGYHILKGEDYGQAYQAAEALSMPLDISYRLDFSYRNEEELLRRKRINEYLLEKISDQSKRGKILAELGIIHSLLSDPHKAIYYYEVALVIAREIGDRRSEAIVCWNFGLAYENVGDLKRAVDHMQISVDFERQMGHRDAEKYADCLKNVRARLEKM